MKKLSRLLIGGIVVLAGCSSSGSLDTVNDIKNMSVPLVNANVATETANSRTVNDCYQDNSILINNMKGSLKAKYLEDVKPAEIFDTNSEAHNVYGALSKLEQMSVMNETYRKENNIKGLSAINAVLKPLAVNV